ncbi:hypothetical protein PINS_up001274 [Pythium insidiosum]|nr:hypothetical protein PINS_up001274 [Pythium insidiosum]
MFGKAAGGGGSSDDLGVGDAKAKSNSLARAVTLSLYDLSPDGHVVVADENVSCGGDDRVLHVFSGPFLGVVRFEADDTSGGGVASPATSFVGADALHDSPSARSTRTQSSIFSVATPSAAAAMLSPSASSASAAATPTSYSAPDGSDTSDIKRTTLEFFAWERDGAAPLQRVGAAVECPLWLEWERVTHRFCALVYATSVRILRVAATPTPEAACVHEIPTPQRVVALHWFHQTLFVATQDGVLRVCFVSKSRVFAFDLADRAVFTTTGDDNATAFPRPQPLVDGLSTILGVVQRRLVVAAPVKSLQFVALENLVYQSCLLVAVGQPDAALSVAETLRRELTDWIAAVFEAFGFVSHALRLSKLSLRQRVGMLIKHERIDDLEKLLLEQAASLPAARDTTVGIATRIERDSPPTLTRVMLCRARRCCSSDASVSFELGARVQSSSSSAWRWPHTDTRTPSSWRPSYETTRCRSSGFYGLDGRERC